MKNVLFLSLAILLTACTQTPSSSNPQSNLDNPLYMERYAEELIEHMVRLVLNNDPILEDEGKKAIVDEARKNWLDHAREARGKQREGMYGSFISITSYAKGQALYIDDALYFGSEFEAEPGPGTHVFLSTTVDPRDVEFPDDSAIDLGPLERAYGAHSYSVKKVDDPMKYRTVVLWDTELERLQSFAQLSQ